MGLLPRRTTPSASATTTAPTSTAYPQLTFRSLARLSYAESQVFDCQLNEKMSVSVASPPSSRRSTRSKVMPASRGTPGVKHRHAGVPPAVAALLAVTAIPPPGSRKQRTSQGQRREEAVLEMFVEPPTPTEAAARPTHHDDHHSPMPSFDDDGDDDGSSDEYLSLGSVELSRDPSRDSTRSALSVLLSPPDDYEEGSRLEKSPSDSQLSIRSNSTESVPSLDDDESTLSWNSSPPMSRRSSNDPRFRGLASPPEDCHYDHPLMWDSDDDVSSVPTLELAGTEEAGYFSEDTVKRIARRLNFKSNISASIRVLKSAARSFSSISVSTPLIQPDDYLTRSILSITPQFTDEKRPAPSLDTPTPALRRYLNPTNSIPDSPCTGAIQMQTYHSNQKTCDSPATVSAALNPTARPREVRENGDFLRVIVLEMNMRREGKLSDTAQGKARLVLPPRQPCTYRALGDPSRWQAWVCVYDE